MKTPGPYEAIVLADSIASGVRLTTLCCTFPRIVLAEFNTHRTMSRNSASSRAIPVKKRIAQIRENPYVPLSFGKNKRGMQAKNEEVEDTQRAADKWYAAAMEACDRAEALAQLGLHKQWANRLVEPFAWHTVICSATEWANYFALRISEHAQPEIRKVSEAMKAAMDASVFDYPGAGDWHLPLVDETEMGIYTNEILVKLSVARCAAVSYERHMEQDTDKELARYDKLLSAGHMSPFEHAAMVGWPFEGGVMTDPLGVASEHNHKFYVKWFDTAGCIGNFKAPWIQHRKLIPGEAVFGSKLSPTT